MNQSNRAVCRQILARETRILEQYLWYQKDMAAMWWKQCDKATPEGKRAFKLFNKSKDDARKTANRLVKLRATLKALK